jgi:hypothetical protein
MHLSTAFMREKIIAHKILVGKNYGRGPVGRPRHRWKIILKCVLKSERKWFRLVQGRTGWLVFVN